MQPTWFPTETVIKNANLTKLMQDLGFKDFAECHRWSYENYSAYWQDVLRRLNIKLKNTYQTICDLADGVEQPHWLKGAKLNIADSCFNADPGKTAIIAQAENDVLFTWTYDYLNKSSNRIANSLITYGFKEGDAIAIDMPMTAESVAIYLGIIKAGCVVVSIADSFAAEEISTRLKISHAKAIFTQDCILRAQKYLSLYEKVVAANAPRAIVLACDKKLQVSLRKDDLAFENFLGDDDQFTSVSCDPEHHLNILFSSGTTGVPKAIPWTHLTPIKSAADGFYHQNITPDSVVAWPTNLGWMMGPWLIFAALINQATIGLYYGAPTNAEFGKFIQDAKVTVLGVVPSIVKTWRSTKAMETFNWQSIEVFSSTGETSNIDDMNYLMQLAGNKPVIEYCGGTEIGGAYVSSTIVQPNIAAVFSTPAMGMNIAIIDEEGKPTENGEVAIIPPSIGLSQELLNSDHQKIYYANMPQSIDGKILRRHGDQVERLENNYYRELGRVDDTMNLGGIKVSSAEIERALCGIAGIKETAAIAVNPPGGGPSLLVIYAVPNSSIDSIEKIKQYMQELIRLNLNPLFKIHDVIAIEQLPRTASNKVMRRVLRDCYKQ